MDKLKPLLTAALAALLFQACAATGERTGGGESLAIKGALDYPARIALPADSRAIVELRDVSRPDGAVVAERRIELAGRQVPIPFELALDRAKLDPARRYALRGGVLSGGRPAWATDPVMVDRASGVVDLGTLPLHPVRTAGFATDFQCGDQRATVSFTQDAMRLEVGGQAFDLRQAVSGSGARYEVPGDPTTSFWNVGRRATLVVKGRTFPECVQVDERRTAFRARGNEPGWVLDIDGDRLKLDTRYGARRYETATPAAQRAGAFTRYATRVDGRDLTVTVFNRLCRDNMTGMRYPHAVEVLLGDEKLAGCGGEAAALLRGPEWIVAEIAGKPVAAGARVTLNFGEDGRLSGRASCNAFNAQYTLTGETLTVSRAAGTLMACPPPLMQQEELFLAVLQATSAFDIGPDGALVLRAADGRTITARR
jgi:heat shock protein HslJ/uncharacterized lipoprotein YbaY